MYLEVFTYDYDVMILCFFLDSVKPVGDLDICASGCRNVSKAKNKISEDTG